MKLSKKYLFSLVLLMACSSLFAKNCPHNLLSQHIIGELKAYNQQNRISNVMISKAVNGSTIGNFNYSELNGTFTDTNRNTWVYTYKFDPKNCVEIDFSITPLQVVRI